MKTLAFLIVAYSLSVASVQAELSLPHFFSDHMVIQRERPVAVWGQASANADVQISFKTKTVSTKADANGNWRATIESGLADAKGSVLTVTSGDRKVEIHDVLVGEVWFASGQSNMFFTMDRVPAYKELIAKADYPGLRMFLAPLVTAVEPQSNINGQWSLASPETVPGFSAVAFFFALKIHQELNIPVGVIKSAWGGKPVETFTSREALNTLPATKALVDEALESDAAFVLSKATAAHETRLKNWQDAVAAEHKKPASERKALGKKPQMPKRPLNTEGKPGVLFNSMIHPFVGYTMRGAIWYQGEGNAKAGAVPYDQTLPLMIRDWRKRWGDEFSFYFVQLANYRAPSTAPGTPDPWALLQDRMRLILQTTPKTGMAIINDVGEEKDIHPKDKQTPGERLARWALAKDYGRDVVISGPLYKASLVQGDMIRLTFEHCGKGLQARNGESLKRFEIAGADRVWRWADAKIVGADSVHVSHAEVKKPVAVRYAWASNPTGANLINSDGLPASVFRTDDWDDVDPKVVAVPTNALDERRAQAIEIKVLNAKIANMDPQSPEAKELRAKVKDLLSKFKASAPAK